MGGGVVDSATSGDGNDSATSGNGNDSATSGTGVEQLTATGDWPTESFRAVDDEFAVERRVPLGR